MKMRVNWKRLSYRCVDYIISIYFATWLWYCIDDRLAAAVSVPGFGHLPFPVISTLFGAIRFATDTTSELANQQ